MLYFVYACFLLFLLPVVRGVSLYIREGASHQKVTLCEFPLPYTL